ncbi:uncharacterized protein ISCGN_024842 [Ixodes scapularis]
MTTANMVRSRPVQVMRTDVDGDTLTINGQAAIPRRRQCAPPAHCPLAPFRTDVPFVARPALKPAARKRFFADDCVPWLSPVHMDGGDCGRKATGMRPATWPLAALLLVLLRSSALGSEFPHHHSGPGGVVVLYHKESPFSGGDRGRTNGHFPKSKHGSTSLVPAASILPSGFVHGRPACARDLDLCVFNHDYPIDKVQSIVDRYYNQMYDLHHTLYKTPPHEVQWVENYTLAFAQEKQHGSFVCRSEAVYLRIGWAKNWKGLWLTVVNTERFPQVTRVEKCKYRGKPCDYMVPCYKSSCKQREMLFPLIAVNPYDPGQKPSIELFPIPSGCVCYVDDFRFH